MKTRARPEIARHYRRWTPREDARLRLLWGSAPLARVAAELGRSSVTTYWRARRLGLPCGCPQGYEYLTDAARRSGFTTDQLRAILRAAGVRLRVAMARPTGATRHYHYVDLERVDVVVVAWAGQETPEDAARRHGVSGNVVRSALRAAGHVSPTGKRRWRLPSATIDAALANYRPGASVRAHAARVGLTPVTLARRLRKAGVLGAKRPGVEVRLPADVVDRVLEGARA